MDGQAETGTQNPPATLTRRELLRSSLELGVTLGLAPVKIPLLYPSSTPSNEFPGPSRYSGTTQEKALHVFEEVKVHNGMELHALVSKMTPDYFESLRQKGINSIKLQLDGETDYRFEGAILQKKSLPNSYPSETGEMKYSEVNTCLPFQIPPDFTCELTSMGEPKKLIFPPTSEVGILLEGFRNGGYGELLLNNLEICGGGFNAHPDLEKDERPIQALVVIKEGNARINSVKITSEELVATTSIKDAGSMSGVIALTDKAVVIMSDSTIGDEHFPMHWDSLFAHLGGFVYGKNVTIMQDRGCCAGATGFGGGTFLKDSTLSGPENKWPWKGFGLFGQGCDGSLTNCTVNSSSWGVHIGSMCTLKMEGSTIKGSPLPVMGGGKLVIKGTNRIHLRREPSVAKEISPDGFILHGPLAKALIERFASVKVAVPHKLEYEDNGVSKIFGEVTDVNKAIMKRISAPVEGGSTY